MTMIELLAKKDLKIDTDIALDPVEPQAEEFAFIAAIQAISQLSEQALRIFNRLRNAHSHREAISEVLDRHISKLKSIKTVIGIIDDEEDLRILTVTTEIARLETVQNRLNEFLETLDPKRNKIYRTSGQLVCGSKEEKKLGTIMDELVQVETVLLWRIHVAHVGVIRTIGKEVVVSVEAVERIDGDLREHVQNCSGLRIARLLKGRHPSVDGTVLLKITDLEARNDSIITRNQAFQTSTAIEKDIWEDITSLKIKDNFSESQDLQINYSITPYNYQGMIEKAKDMYEPYEGALKGKETALERDHTLTVNTVKNLSTLYETQGNLGKTEERYVQTLGGYKKTLVPNHPTTLNTAENLSEMYISGHLEEAELLRRQFLQDRHHALDSNSDRIAGDVVLLPKGSVSLTLHDSSDLISSSDVPPSLTSGSILSGTSRIAKTAAQQFVEIIIRDGAMQPLFLIAIERAGLEKFKQNFFRLLTKYATDLRGEANSPIQFEFARLVRSRANFIVYLIAESVQNVETSSPPRIAVPGSERERDLEQYLEQLQPQPYCEPTIAGIHGRTLTLDPEELSDEDDKPCEPERQNLINLDEVKKFMVESEAYAELRTSFRNLIFPPEEVIDVGSRPSDMNKRVTPIPYRLFWICVGHPIDSSYV
ncbi:hypothetical protein P3342_008432 [Pyrenophora teres f. teres]|nr:hypothetical protein P3342_008432 [Pyrenophora teres f. teres]